MAVKYTSFALVVNGGGLIDMALVRALDGTLFNGTLEAGNAVEAMSRLRMVTPDQWRGTALKAPPGLVLVSSQVEDMDPFELCYLIKDSYPDMFTVLVSEPGQMADMIARLPGSSFDEMMLVPFTSVELSARVELLLNRHVRGVDAKGLSPAQGSQDSRCGRMPQPGETLTRFLILEIVKASSGIAIYKVMDKEDNRLYALKALFGADASDIAKAEAFEREGRIMSNISHPNVLSCRERGDSNGVKYIVSEWVDGPNLEDYLLVRGVPPLETFFKIAKELAFALKALHLQGLAHRDVKLSNVLLRRPGFDAVLSDFGISMEAGVAPDAGYIEGSRLYMAPELLAGGQADTRTDIYSYGATLYHFLTGSPPHKAIEDDSSTGPCSARLLRPETPEGLDCFLRERCMAAAPERRPDSMEDIIEALSSIERSVAEYSSSKSGYVVLAVDDEPAALEALDRLLRREPYKLICAESGEKALEIMASTQVHLLITDYRMPGMNGVELARIVRERSPETVRIVFSGQADTESVISAINAGNIYKFLVKSWFRDDLRQNIRLALDHYALQERNRELDRLLSARNRELSEANAALEMKVAERSAEALDAVRRLEEHCNGLVEALFRLMELHSEDMSEHGRRVGVISKALALAAGASQELASDIETAGYLHDIGKMALGIERHGHLSKDEETRLMRRHPSIGSKILASVPAFSEIAAMVRYHHERYDGQGVAEDSAGEEICFGARVIAIADRFDRFARVPETGVSRRLQFAEESIFKLSGLELDPLLLKIFLSGTSASVYSKLYVTPASPLRQQ